MTTVELSPGAAPGPGAAAPSSPTPRSGPTAAQVLGRRVTGAIVLLGPLVWAWHRATAGSDVVNTGGARLVGDLLGRALHPALDGPFLEVVARASAITVVYAVLGAVGALAIGIPGGLVMSDLVAGERPGRVLRVVRAPIRLLLVAVRSIHELVWALLLVSALGLDPLVGVLALSLPFGAQTAKVFAETLDATPRGPVRSLRAAGARPVPAFVYGVLPGAAPLLLSYSFYRLECALRSAVILGVVGLGGLGQELTTSLQSRNWDEVWTLVLAVLLISAVVDLWSTRVRTSLAVASCSDWSTGSLGAGTRLPRWVVWSGLGLVPLTAWCWWYSGVTFGGLFSERTRTLTAGLVADMTPPALPRGGWTALGGGVLDTLAMAVLAMGVAVALTVVLAPLGARPRRAPGSGPTGVLRWGAWAAGRLLLLALRSVPPTVWAVVALLAFFPGVVPGAVALGLYTGGILGRLVAEAWEGVNLRPRDALLAIGVPRATAGLAAMLPATIDPLVTYTLYRFEICVRDTAIVGVVGAAGLGRLLEESFASFDLAAVTTLLIASFAVSLAMEQVSRAIRAARAS